MKIINERLEDNLWYCLGIPRGVDIKVRDSLVYNLRESFLYGLQGSVEYTISEISEKEIVNEEHK